MTALDRPTDPKTDPTETRAKLVIRSTRALRLMRKRAALLKAWGLA